MSGIDDTRQGDEVNGKARQHSEQANGGIQILLSYDYNLACLTLESFIGGSSQGTSLVQIKSTLGIDNVMVARWRNTTNTQIFKVVANNNYLS